MTTYTVKRLCWFGVRLWKAIHERKEKKAKEKAAAKGGAR